MELHKINEDHWVLGNHHIKYSNSFGNSGWYLEDTKAFPETYDDFLEVLNNIIGDETHQRMVPPPATVKQPHKG